MTYQTGDAATRAGVSVMQVHRWARAGAFAVDAQQPGHGHYRQFTDDDVALLRLLGEVSTLLRSCSGPNGGLSPDVVVRIAAVFRARGSEHRWLILNAERVYVARTLYVHTAGLVVAL